MKYEVIVSNEAATDIMEIVEWYETQKEVGIIAVIHQARNPEYIEKRLSLE
jgi:plasmid stabilization system protein ParE